MAIDPGTTLILITCLICTIVLAFAGKETGDKTDTRHDNEQRKRKQKRKHIMSETDTGNTQIDKRVECVVLPGDRRSGISCDWANATKETDE